MEKQGEAREKVLSAKRAKMRGGESGSRSTVGPQRPGSKHPGPQSPGVTTPEVTTSEAKPSGAETAPGTPKPQMSSTDIAAGNVEREERKPLHGKSPRTCIRRAGLKPRTQDKIGRDEWGTGRVGLPWLRGKKEEKTPSPCHTTNKRSHMEPGKQEQDPKNYH